MENMNSAMLLQLMQILSGDGHESPEMSLMALKPFMPPKMQLVMELMTKMQEVRELMDEISAMP